MLRNARTPSESAVSDESRLGLGWMASEGCASSVGLGGSSDLVIMNDDLLDRVEGSEANDLLDLFPKLTVEMRREMPLGTRLLTLLANFFRIVGSLAGAGDSA